MIKIYKDAKAHDNVYEYIIFDKNLKKVYCTDYILRYKTEYVLKTFSEEVALKTHYLVGEFKDVQEYNKKHPEDFI